MASTVDEIFEAMKAALETKGSEIVNKTKGVIAYKVRPLFYPHCAEDISTFLCMRRLERTTNTQLT